MRLVVVWPISIKQTTENPKVESALKGWELMLFFLATFPPSKVFRPILEAYLEMNAEDKSQPQVQVRRCCIARCFWLLLHGSE